VTDTFRVEFRRVQNALSAELFKVVRRRMTYILLLALGGLVTLFYVLLWLRIRDGPGSHRNSYQDWLALKSAISFLNVTPYGFALERLFATVVCVVFAGTMTGNEFDWRTVGPVTGRGIRRWHFLLSKTLVSMAFTVTAVALGFIVAAAASAWFTHLYHLPYGTIDGARVGGMLASAARTIFVVLPFVTLALLSAVVWRSAGLAVGISLGLYFMESIFTGVLTDATGWLSHVPEGLININADSLMSLNGVNPRGGAGPLLNGSGGEPVWRATVILLAWILGFAAIGFWRFQRRDIQE
jgi:ABC-type transport system involved in multi-copper enzyme maturation permease subunit